MAQTLLSEKDLKIILQNCTKKSDAKYVSSHLKPFSKDGNVDGFMGEYFILEIKYEVQNERKSEDFFVKCVPTQTEIQKEMVLSTNSYKKEVFFLDFLMKEYEKYGLETNFAPKSYLCKADELMVLENVASKQFVLPEKYKYFDLNQCKTGLEALAKYHAASMLYEEIKSKELGTKFCLEKEYPELLKEMLYDLTSNNIQYQIIESGFKSLVFMIEELQEEKKYRDDFKNKIKLENMLSAFSTNSNFKKVTGHGDLWFKNIFFKYENTKALQCKIIDYQVLRYFYPIYDVLTILYINTSKNFRKIHLKELLQYYYDTLTELFIKHGSNISDHLPLNEFKQSFNFVNCSALYNSIGVNSFVLLSDEKLRDSMNNYEGTFDTHFNVFCECFKTDLVYRNWVAELIDELHDFIYSDCEQNML